MARTVRGGIPGAAGTASAVPLFRVVRRRRTSFSINFQISGALSHNAKTKWTETSTNNAKSCVVQRVRMLRPSIEKLMV